MRQPKIAFTGPECSGKSTLSKWLAKELSYEIVQEYAREYLTDHPDYTKDDLDKIAVEQFERSLVPGPLVLDTEMLVMKIWSEEKYHIVSEQISQLLKRQDLDFYFLCKPDFEWISDPMRENPLDRDRLFQIYEFYLEKFNFPYCVLSGTENERKQRIKATLANTDLL